MCARCLAENDVMEYMARSDMRGEIVHSYMFYTHMLCKRKAQFFRHTEYFLDVLQLYSSRSTGQWSLPITSERILLSAKFFFSSSVMRK